MFHFPRLHCTLCTTYIQRLQTECILIFTYTRKFVLKLLSYDYRTRKLLNLFLSSKMLNISRGNNWNKVHMYVYNPLYVHVTNKIVLQLVCPGAYTGFWSGWCNIIERSVKKKFASPCDFFCPPLDFFTPIIENI